MSRCRCDPIDIAGCQCHLEDSNDMDFSGGGTASDPFTGSPILDVDNDNLLSSSVAGLAAFLPPEIADPPCCRITSSIGQTIPTAVDQILLFNLERFDTDSMHDLTTNNSRITFNTAGVYILTGNVKWEANASGDRKLYIRVNAGDILVSIEASVDQDDPFDQSVTTLYKFAAGDYVELLVAQNSGSNLTVLKSGTVSPEFAAARLGVG